MIYAMERSELERMSRREIEAKFIGAEMLIALYRTDPEVVAKILPKPLKPYREPLALVFIARYPETNFDCVYNEGCLGLLATYKGELGGYCLSMPVTDDMALIGGREVHGFPKKIAEEISLARKGKKVTGRIVRKGEEIMTMTCDLKDKASLSDFSRYFPSENAEEKDLQGNPCLTMISYLFKSFPSTTMAGFDYLPRLVRQVSLFRPRQDLMTGTGTVVIKSSPRDPLGDVPVRKVEMMLYGTYDNDMLPGRYVAKAWNIWKFLPHAFYKTDFFYKFPKPKDPVTSLWDGWRRRRKLRKY